MGLSINMACECKGIMDYIGIYTVEYEGVPIMKHHNIHTYQCVKCGHYVYMALGGDENESMD